jgi:hypothetical protein
MVPDSSNSSAENDRQSVRGEASVLTPFFSLEKILTGLFWVFVGVGGYLIGLALWNIDQIHSQVKEHTTLLMDIKEKKTSREELMPLLTSVEERTTKQLDALSSSLIRVEEKIDNKLESIHKDIRDLQVPNKNNR